MYHPDDSRRRLDARIGRHPRFEHPVRIVQLDFDAVDEVGAFLESLHRPGGKLGGAADEADPAFPGSVRVGIHRYQSRLAQTDAPQVGLGHEGAQPDVFQVADGEHGRTGIEIAARLGRGAQHDAVEGGEQLGVGELLSGQGHPGIGRRLAFPCLINGFLARAGHHQVKIGLGLGQRRAGLSNLVFPAAGFAQAEAFFGGLAPRNGCGKGILGRIPPCSLSIVVLAADATCLEYRCVTFEIGLSQHQLTVGRALIRFCPLDIGHGLGDLLVAAAFQQILQMRPGLPDPRLGGLDLFRAATGFEFRQHCGGISGIGLNFLELERKVRVVQYGQPLIAGYRIPFIHQPLMEATCDLEGHVHLGDVDVTGQLQLPLADAWFQQSVPDCDGQDDDGDGDGNEDTQPFFHGVSPLGRPDGRGSAAGSVRYRRTDAMPAREKRVMWSVSSSMADSSATMAPARRMRIGRAMA
ncbi:hypothetical protein DESC_830079 [Desulfosarcina cetonica]|nr:hypothetical protein DESC_830079 [Desulfosarcina cetonica]